MILRVVVMENVVVADLHCDLLWYLSLDSKRTPHDLEVRCAIPQLKAGNVKVQTMAIFAETTAGSSESGWKQAEVFKELPKEYPKDFVFLKNPEQFDGLFREDRVGIIAAVENGSAICGEGDDLDDALDRLTAFQKKAGKLLYASLTWNSENRFGGGAFTKIGLKDDGKRFIDYLSRTGIALDLSHASDHLAYGVLEYIDKEKLALAVMASHSNMRTVADFPRNLPDDIAKEIIRRNGLIGINFIRYLLGRETHLSFCRQIKHLVGIGGSKSVAFGADFFFNGDVALAHRKPESELFFSGFDHAGRYPNVIELLCKDGGLPGALVRDVCSGNFIDFFNRLHAS